ncbi:LANO_0D08548g1_1 [Lachancea nothofagi CBS 11611]|uniref:LANO_0D08548g1_1 n=1 Tax=Lachancea nothofagi CBS 11611 TaxID=1266666 RepID=A0A1G4JIW9_9SACH|nr:LANO_0D08548g1_1 [Lachancea nothofagi CBS 11611]
MSGSFWKFGQNYASESPLSRLLNRAFVKVSNSNNDQDTHNRSQEKIDRLLASPSSHSSEDDNDDREKDEDGSVDVGDRSRKPKNENEDDDDDEDDRKSDHENELRESGNDQPDSESDYKDYEPDMEVLDELLDDEELYTELMCSNFKLLIFFKYPQVLARLVDYVTNEHVLSEDLNQELGTAEGSENRNANEDSDLKSDQEHGDNDSGDSKANESTGGLVKDQDTPGSDQQSVSSAETSITLPPDSEEQSESRRARMAAEILSADVWPISSAFMDHDDLLTRLWSMLDHTAPLSIVPSTYFMKINERLLDMDVAGMLHFILAQDDLVDKFLKHIDNPPLMDFLLKVISTDKPDTSTGVIEQLGSQDLIPKLLDHLETGNTSSTKSAAGDFLKALITISANSNNEIASAIGPNGLTRKLVSPSMVEKLMKIMLSGGTSLSNGVGIIIELIRKNNSDYDFVQVMYTTLETHPPNDRDPIYLGYLIQCSASHLADFNKMLMETELPPLETPFGFIEPLGFERFKICELVAELLHCSNMTLLNEPNGEEIIAERDSVREKTLQLEGNETAYNRNELGEDGEDVLDKMADLRIATTNASNSSDDDEKVIRPKDEDGSAGNEIQSEGSTDGELPEKALRENPVVGDHLKIALQDNSVITAILEMFFAFPWNNFLHNVVFDIVQQIFNGPLKTGFNRFLIADLFTGAKLTHMIMEGDKKCEDYENETGLRLGYMGHLTLIAEEVAKFAAYVDEMKISFSNPSILDTLSEPRWKEYTETVLADTRENYSSILGDFEEEDDHEDVEVENNEISGAANDEDLDYRNYDQDEENADDYAEYNSVDSPRYYQYDDGQGNKTNIHLNPDVDYDIGPGTFIEGDTRDYDDDNDGDEGEGNGVQEKHPEKSKVGGQKERKSKFSNYMSHQLSKDFNTSSSSDDDEEDVWNNAVADNSELKAKSGLTESGEGAAFNPSQFGLEDEEDDYMDPNDDGQSYAKPHHPLYDNMLSRNSPGNRHYFNQEDTSISSIASIAENDDDSDGSDKDDAEEDDDQYSLCRTSSKDNMAWDSSEQNRIINSAQYRQNQQESEK